jgi:hypothetical protein
MRDFLIIWVGLSVNFLAGYWYRGWVDRHRPRVIRPVDLSPEFKAWLLDYIEVNSRRIP